MDFIPKETYDIQDLIGIVKKLRAPDGCPWDKVQTHETIRKDFLEEVYEAVEAIDEQDPEHLREELGDVLLQVVFHSVLETEQGRFTFEDVVDEVSRKMIVRHPHVFGEVSADTTEQVLKNWDTIKMQTHSQQTVGEAMEGVSRALPSLMRCAKLQKKAKRGGVVFDDREQIFAETATMLQKMKASSGQDEELMQQLTGNLLFSIVKLSYLSGVDAEQSLYNTCDRFIQQFKAYERLAAEAGIDIQDPDRSVTDQLWKQVSDSEN